jgi:CubicO group peptidase (beta-lactamase class C family)
MQWVRIPGLALVVVEGDRIVYAKGYGKADASGRAVTPETPFLLGSVTKPFTALALMQLVEAGRVHLDAPVQRYLPWFRVADPVASSHITVRHLLYHTSGMPQPPTSDAPPDTSAQALERAVRSLATLKPVGAPGRSFGYSNGNYDTLGMIIAAVSGEPYERYVKEHVFAPLDMRNSYASQDEAIRHGMASGYRWWFGIPRPATLPYDRGNLPSGYIIASAEDMGHFLIAQMNGGRYAGTSVLSAAGIDTTHAMPSTPYAMGWDP